MIRIEHLQKAHEAEYEKFVLNHPAGMLYYGLKWRDLTAHLTNGQAIYLVAIENNKIVGVMPSFLIDGPYGKVINALPFYGSHGEPLVAAQRSDVYESLLRAFSALAEDQHCASATMITNPLVSGDFFPEIAIAHNFTDERVGQILALPDNASEKALFDRFEGRARTAIRKARKEGVSCRHENDNSVMSRLWSLHKRNMEELGGMAKPLRFFELVAEIFEYGKDYHIATALKDGREIAYLLVFHYADTAEYFTPCVAADYRSCQPLSLIIYESMKNAIEEGMQYWNFGGTWKNQDGVYQFKKSWGASDLHYRYLIQVRDQQLLGLSLETLIGAYPYFYTLPFSQQVRAC
jgi:hypothetical protein